MSKIIFLCWLFVGVLSIRQSCLHAQEQDVFIENHEIIINGKPFYPVGVNYIVRPVFVDSIRWSFTPGITYCPDTIGYISCGNDSMRRVHFYQDMLAIKRKGFNSIRLAGLGVKKSSNSSSLQFNYKRLKRGKWPRRTYTFQSSDDYTGFLDMVEDVVQLIDSAGLKVLFITGGHQVDEEMTRKRYGEYLNHVASRLDKYDNVYAYDLINEPAFFSYKKNYQKCEIKKMVADWVKEMGTSKLTTIGLFGLFDIWQWDPAILDVDFIGLHTYPYMNKSNGYSYDKAINMVSKTLKWYSENVDKPWLIGETSFPGSNYHNSELQDIGDESQQLNYANYLINALGSYGGLGFYWWQFSEVFWWDFTVGPKARNNVYGIRYSTVNNVPDSLQFTWKSAAEVLPRFRPYIGESTYLDDSTYYNLSRNIYGDYKGVILDSNQKVIKGAFIKGTWAINQKTHMSNTTFSRMDGSFNLNAPCKKCELIGLHVTALGMANVQLKKEEIKKKESLSIVLYPVGDSCDNLNVNPDLDEQFFLFERQNFLFFLFPLLILLVWIYRKY